MDGPVSNATVVERDDLGDRLAILRVRPEDAPVPDFVPGQFVQLGPPARAGEAKPERRAYSIASSPADKDALEFLIALVTGGRLTPELWLLRPGDRCWLDARPLGSFTLADVPPGKDLVLVATGTGIAPYVSMLRTYGAPPAQPEAQRWKRCVVVHGVRRTEDLAYGDELRSRAAADPSVCYLPIVSQEPDPERWSGLRGRVQSVLEENRCSTLSGTALEPATCHAFLCGNPDMIAEVRAMLVARGFVHGSARRGGNLHSERYW